MRLRRELQGGRKDYVQLRNDAYMNELRYEESACEYVCVCYMHIFPQLQFNLLKQLSATRR